MPGQNKHWYVVYTKPRSEKKVYNLLIERGYEAYCPINKVRRKWSDRMKWVEEPLFKSYVFVRASEEEKTEVRMVNGIVNYIYWLGQPAVIRDKEIDTIRRFLNDYSEVEVMPLTISTDERVIIRKGALMNREARVIKVLSNKVQVILESIGYKLVAMIDKSNLLITEKNR